MKIGVGVCCWIEENSQLPELKRCLDSLEQFYPVFVVNGKWKDMKGDFPRSTPEAQELINSYPNVIRFDMPNELEFVCRNKYLIEAGHFNLDYIFWVDTDEWVEMPLGKEFFERGLEDLFKRSPDSISSHLHFYDDRMGGVAKQKRVIRYPAFVRHRDRHNQVWFLDQEVMGNTTAHAPRGMIIHQNKNFRSQQREEKMRERNLANPIH